MRHSKKLIKRIRKFIYLRIKNFYIALVLVILIETGILLFYQTQPSLERDLFLQSYADQVLEKCSSSSYRPSCYDEELPKLMDFISMEDALKVAKIVQSQDSSYRYCHVLGHKLSAKEYHKDTDNWKDIIHRCPYGECANGCQHGVLQERFRGEFLTD